MRCVVTGASGQLGASLARELVARGHAVLGIVRESSDLFRLEDVLDRIELAHAGLENMDAAAGAIAAFRPDVAFHLAWTGVTAQHRNSDAQITTNVTGTLEFFRIVREAGCSAFVGVGSQAEFGPYDVPLTEDLPTRPRTSYGAAKLACGLLTAKLAELAGMRHVWVRLIATYGPADDANHLIASVALQVLRGEVPQLSPGGQLCDYLYVDDAAEALAVLGENAEASGVFVLGSGQVHSVREIGEAVRDLVDPSAALDFGALDYRPDQVMHLQADISRIRQVTGWEPRTPLAKGLAQTVEYLRIAEARG